MKRVFILAAILAAFVVSGCAIANGVRRVSVEGPDIKATYESDTRTPEQIQGQQGQE